MNTRSVRKYAGPKYPTRLEIAACPGLLQRHQPPAWLQWPELTGAVGLFLLADATRLAAADNPPKDDQTPVQAAAVAIVAPIFQHGEGRGATGCIVMAPPVFLSEEEALKIIREEMAAKGVQLLADTAPLAGVTESNPRKRRDAGVPRLFTADAADPKKHVVVEFVSQMDAPWWDWAREKDEGKTGLNRVGSYDLPITAEYLAARVKRQATDKLYFGTFYDPLAGKLDMRKLAAEEPPPGGKTFKDEYDEAVEAARVESRKLLRLQVQDFLEWLKAQGVI